MSEALWYRFNGVAMIPLNREAAMGQFFIDGRYLLEAHHERSYKRHRAYFASINEAFKSLGPTEEFPSAEHLRKYALIRTGWRDERNIWCVSAVMAKRMAMFCRPFDSFAIMVADGKMLRVWTARSQNYKTMGREDFNKSMDDVLGYVAGLLEVPKAVLEAQGEMA